VWLIAAVLLAVFVLPDGWDLPVVIAGAVLEVGDGLFWLRWSSRRRAVVGAEALIGRLAVVSERCDPIGHVKVNGELWRAEVLGAQVAEPGATVRIRSLSGLTLQVEPAD
jgi:membrane protein implicated in regulation of membrane protease activity